ncbi:putative sensor histidine kinase NtrY-like [Flavobacteriaceae bacterium UJ101]|nr:putative sensor histidine kinase NtrY-like [Flavobacteriaceae bacterium UJ101]
MNFLNRLSLFQQIFLAIVLVLSLASIAFVVTAIVQSDRTVKQYNITRLFRKEERIRTTIDYAISLHSEYIDKTNLVDVVTPKMYELKDTDAVETRLYDLEGQLLFDVNPTLDKQNENSQLIHDSILNKISKIPLGESVLVRHKNKLRSSFSYIRNGSNEKIGIIEIPYIADNTFLEEERDNLIRNIVITFFFVFLFALGLIYFFSRNISDRVKAISDKIKETDITSNLQTIEYEGKDELRGIVDSYNKMVVQLEESTQALAKIEREEAWKKMARQVAHEIKNPLTPMRLSVQAFQMRYDPSDVDSKEKVNNLCNSLVQQIDTLSNIASAFADFAKMPARKDEEFNAVSVIKNTLEIFDPEHVHLEHNKDFISLNMDKSQLSRVMNNLVKNAIQAIPPGRKPNIRVQITDSEHDLKIAVKDNGVGIPVGLREKIFEPKFTTKNSGMGLGLAMVKKIVTDYNATIELESQLNEGSTFTIFYKKPS